MYSILLIGMAAFLILWPAFPEEGPEKETLQILKKLGEIDQRLKRIEEEIRELRPGPRPPAGEKRAVDVRQTPEYRALEKQLHALQEKLKSEVLKNPAEIWQALGDPKELSRRLDMLVEAFGPTIPAEATREDFKKDVEALKEKIGKELSEQELYERVRQMVSERLASADNEREKDWLQRQLEWLRSSKGEERKAAVGRFMRFENVRALHELAEKYSIPREQMAKCGLAFIGHERGPAVGAPPPDRGRRPGPPPGGVPERRKMERRP